ncbi:hypothetical protein [Aureimonas sp. AU12]|uniref:hypothetical protein n=1 Tax=Aureimonas sp. AU12 TaxID=1638161 RepID=UPI0012E3A0CA|nr:hypothetical protein [Aureimonas sp. AU12]
MIAVSAAGLTLTGCREENAMTDEAWTGWLADWRWMQAVAERRGWHVAPLAASALAGEAAMRRLEAAAGLPVLDQLREVLTRHSASVRFVAVFLVVQAAEDDQRSGAGRIRNPGGYLRAYIRMIAEGRIKLPLEVERLRKRR